MVSMFVVKIGQQVEFKISEGVKGLEARVNFII